MLSLDESLIVGVWRGVLMLKSIHDKARMGHIDQAELFVTSRSVLHRMRNFLAGQAVGVTRDEALLEEVLKCAFCRVFIEREKKVFLSDEPQRIADHYHEIFHAIRQKFSPLFKPDDEILLVPEHIAYVDYELATIFRAGATHDLIGDIYETFIGSAYRGQEGQFFTPRNAVRALVELTTPTTDDLIIDPACGSGSFLLEAARYIRASEEISPNHLHGIDKDADVARLAQLHLALQYDSLFPISCSDSLLWSGNGFASSSTKARKGQFTLILTNPPFGSKIVALLGEARRNFALAHKWRLSKSTGRYQKLDTLDTNPSPQVLFVEQCISLLAPGGRLGMIIPESVLSNPSHRYVAQYILDQTTPIAVIGMPEALFKTGGRSGTHTKVCLLVLEKRTASPNHQIFMAEAKWCGHDSRARDIPKDDIPTIVSKFKAFKTGKDFFTDSLGFLIPYTNLKNHILAPHFYNPYPIQMMETLEASHDFYKISDMVQEKYLSIATGDEIGKLSYGTGEIPFVRTSDISNWEIKVDPKHVVSREVYKKYATRQDVKAGDILMVRDGTYLIGTCAFISHYDEEIVYQSHIYKVRVHPTAPFDNYLLLAVLSSPPVVAQIKAMSFTQDIINTLGDRIYDLTLPIPKSLEKRKKISEMVKQVIEDRIEARELARKARLAVIDTL